MIKSVRRLKAEVGVRSENKKGKKKGKSEGGELPNFEVVSSVWTQRQLK